MVSNKTLPVSHSNIRFDFQAPVPFKVLRSPLKDKINPLEIKSI